MLDKIPDIVRTMLDLQAEVSQLEERLTWLNRIDLPDYDKEKAEKVYDLYQKKTIKLLDMRSKWL